MPVVGCQQSPIKIETAKAFKARFDPNYFVIRYRSGAITGSYDLHHHQLKDIKPSGLLDITFRGDPWYCNRLHIHRPAEHLVDSPEPAGFEVHFVHFPKGADDGNYTGPKVVLGVRFKIRRGAMSRAGIQALNQLLLPSKEFAVPLDCTHLLPRNHDEWKAWYHYEGSLTSEPFSEDVSWFLLREVVVVAAKDVSELGSKAEQHARSAYPLDRRFVLRSFN